MSGETEKKTGWLGRLFSKKKAAADAVPLPEGEELRATETLDLPPAESAAPSPSDIATLPEDQPEVPVCLVPEIIPEPELPPAPLPTNVDEVAAAEPEPLLEPAPVHSDSPKKKPGWFARLRGVTDEPVAVTPATPELVEDAAPVLESLAEGDIVALVEETPAPQDADETVEDDAPTSEDEAPKKKVGWLARIRQGLAKSASRLTQGIADLFTKRKLDDDALEQLEELLITADLGVSTAAKITAKLAKNRFNQEISEEEVRTALAEDVAEILTPVAQPLVIDASHRLHVVLVVGVNGSGKTTTIGKMARYYRDQGLKVSLAAGDTFRAAAVEQLKVWGERTGCPVIARDQGADAAGLAFDALKDAQERGDDLLLIDTAGRLQNKAGLMAELQKIIRVIRKQDPTAPHTVLQVLDATVGQNAHSQVEIFRNMTEVNGLVLTKLDGTARGGVLVALAEKFHLPVHFIGVGEQADDMRPFAARAFARSLLGLPADPDDDEL